MKHSIILALVLLCTISAVAQNEIAGKVQDAKQKPIAYATVSLLTKDSTLVTGCITDEQGMFSLPVPRGEHLLQVSFIGYHTVCQPVGADKKHLVVTLQEESEMLNEVEVNGRRPLIERQFDKIVLNVSNSPFAAGSNGKDILKRAPGVNVDKDGNVTVNGKSVAVYIDGRPSYLSGEQLRAMLEGTDGNTIEKIEIISNPSAKYDAAGAGGIVNIKLKRNMMRGLNGFLSAAYGGMYFGDVKTWQNSDMFSLNLNYRTEKTYTFASLTQMYANQVNTVEQRSTYTDTLTNRFTERLDSTNSDGKFQYYMARVGNDWYIDKKNTLGFILQVPIMVYRQTVPEGWGYGYSRIDSVEAERSATQSDRKVNSQQYTGNLNFTHVFNDSLEQELTVNLDYNYQAMRNRSEQSTQTTYPLVPSSVQTMGLDIKTLSATHIYSAKLDFQTHFWNSGMIEAGAKWALATTANTMTTDSTVNAVARPTDHSDYKYSEHVAALYISVAKQFGTHFNAKLGLRGEFTHSKGDWVSADTTTVRNYFNLFPTVFMGYNPTEDWSMSASYTRRIRRPDYYSLNPVRRYYDAHHYAEGNPQLTPEFSHNVELNFSYSQYVTLTGYFSHSTDMITMRTEILPNGDGRTYVDNFGASTTHGVSLSLTELPIVPKFTTGEDGKRTLQGAWLALSLNGDYRYYLNRAADNSYVNRCHFGSGYAELTSYLPKDWTISVYGMYDSPMTDGYALYGSSTYMGCSVRKQWREKGLTLTVAVNDLLRSTDNSTEYLGLADGSSSWANFTYRSQTVFFSLNYVFGSQQYTKQRKVGNLEEASRLSSGK